MSEDLVLSALDRLDDAGSDRARSEMAAFVAGLRCAGRPVDPEFELMREAARRWLAADPTWPVWRAWFESRVLMAEVECMWEASTGG